MITAEQIAQLEQHAEELRERCLKETHRMVTSNGAYPIEGLELTWIGPLNGWARVRVAIPDKAPYVHRVRI